jgi:hypothetical protein
MSQIGRPCDRALWYQFRGFDGAEFDGRLLLIFELGDVIEDRVVYWLKQAGFKVEGQQNAFEAHAGFFRGHCDGIIHGVTQKPHILEIKSANKKRFAEFKKQGVRLTAPEYWAQCQCYMGYSSLQRALVVVYCKDNSEVFTERIHFSQSDFQALESRAYSIITADKEPESLPTDHEACKWCEFDGPCRHGQTLQKTMWCGSCQHLKWDGLRPTCTHPEHEFPINHWGMGCPDWLFVNLDALPF